MGVDAVQNDIWYTHTKSVVSLFALGYHNMWSLLTYLLLVSRAILVHNAHVRMEIFQGRTILQWMRTDSLVSLSRHYKPRHVKSLKVWLVLVKLKTPKTLRVTFTVTSYRLENTRLAFDYS